MKTTSDRSPLPAGEVVEFRAGGALAAGPNLAITPVTWTLEGERLQFATPTGPVAYTATISGDVLRLVGPSGRADVLRRFNGSVTPRPPTGTQLPEGQFLSMLATGRVESATLTQSRATITVTGVYIGDTKAERYSVTFQRCEVVRGLAAMFRAHGVLTDGMSPSEADC